MNAGRTGRPSAPVPPALRPATREAIARGRAHLLERQSPDGAWRAVNQGGVPYTAFVLVVERFLGRLSGADAARGSRFLVAQQRPDGGWAASLGIDDSDVDASIMACAALVAAGAGAAEPLGSAALDSGKRYLRDHNAAARARMESRLVAAMAGLWSAADRSPTLAHRLLPGFDWAASRVVVGHALIGFTLFPLAARAIAARGPLEPRSLFERLELAAADRHLCEMQEPSGSWMAVSFYTLLGAVGLHALGRRPSDPRLARALTWIDRAKSGGAEELRVAPTLSEVWDTALALQALQDSGGPDTDAHARALGFLRRQRVARRLQRRARATSSWAFAAECRHSEPDSTSVVIGALAAAADRQPDELNEAAEFLRAMQNPDGGWASFGRSGLLGRMPPRVAPGSIAALADPTSLDVTGRVLIALGRLGHALGDPGVDAAVRMLARAQRPQGSWTSDWFVRDVVGTAFVVRGLRAVGLPASHPALRRALAWLASCQHADGGWGETWRGPGPGMPTATAQVLLALVAAGEAAESAASAAAMFLVERQRTDGGWRDGSPQTAILPQYDLLYENDLFADYTALTALARFQRAREASEPTFRSS